MKKEMVKTSKFMSLILRHEPGAVGIVLDETGWVDVDVLLAAMARHGTLISREELLEVVSTNDKKRFALSADGKRIRANQGHSVEVELGYEEAQPPAVLYHGTARQFADAIRREGLKKMERHHVHLSESAEATLKVGARRGRPVLVTVDAARMRAEGMMFYRTPNGVWLTDSVPARYLTIDD